MRITLTDAERAARYRRKLEDLHGAAWRLLDTFDRRALNNEQGEAWERLWAEVGIIRAQFAVEKACGELEAEKAAT